ncbi:endonuclease/exonuclease/phosphatase family protein [Candidatus Saccharibacteria bacterium]|nr:endonuclease/exonuclease/phosphatase family protein [Candidatus Saccharibacteria bacterium]
MKILQLNVWTGRIKGPLLEFFQKNDFDVVCLQEAVWGNLPSGILENFFVTVEQIKEAGGFLYESRSSNVRLKMSTGIMEQGNVILSRERILDEKIKSVYGENRPLESKDDLMNHEYTVQIVKLENGFSIVNHHGYWLPTPVGDETTVKVMKKVGEFVKETDEPVVMCGDLNIIHASPAMRALDFLRDLTEENKIDSTLNGLKFNGKVACDHILVSPEVKVSEFRVLEDLISDHKALVAKIEL